jgi:predicted MFS family arabinose efflux permease
LLDAPGVTARQVLLPDLAGRAGMSLERANGIFQTIENVSLTLGPLIAGLVIVALGAINALWFDAASFAASAIIVAIFCPRIRAEATGEVADVLAGVKLLAKDHLLRGITLVAVVANFVGAPIFVVLLPAFAIRASTNADTLGVLVAAFAAGTVVGSLAFGILGAKYSRRWVAAAAFAATGVAFGLVALAPPLPLVVVALALGGVATGPINPIAFTVMQERVPAAVRGRVFGAVLGGVLVAAPIGMLMLGAVAEASGPALGFAVAGLAFVMVGAAVAAWPGFRELDVRPG